jgi:hypothetical protein
MVVSWKEEGGRSSAEDEIKLRGKRVAGAKRQATGDKKIGGFEERGRRGERERDKNVSACDARMNFS